MWWKYIAPPASTALQKPIFAMLSNMRSTPVISRVMRCSRVFYLGPDRAGNLLEVVVIERDDGSELAIHAMKMRRRYRQLIREARADE